MNLTIDDISAIQSFMDEAAYIKVRLVYSTLNDMCCEFKRHDKAFYTYYYNKQLKVWIT